MSHPGESGPVPPGEATGHEETAEETMYDRVGGAPWFETLTERFYAAVASDPVLRAVYPEEDLTAARQRLCGFLIQYWGGPADYSEARGHPRLRMRHMPFAIGLAERDAWYGHMAAAVRAGGLSLEDEFTMLRYFAGAATQLTNRA
jgi:hemoglobin